MNDFDQMNAALLAEHGHLLEQSQPGTRDQRKAITAAMTAPELEQEDQQMAPRASTPVNVARCATDCTVLRYAENLADAMQFPAATASLLALGVFSAAAASCRTVLYPDGTPLALGLYVVGEQPPASTKSGVLGKLLKPIQDRREQRNLEINEILKEVVIAKQQTGGKLTPDLEQAERELYTIDQAITDVNSASLDRLCGQQRGYFSIVSAEQTAFDTLTGARSDQPESKEIVLKGFAGEHVSTHRITRNGMRGTVFGAIAIIAQRSVIDTILGQSGGTGLAERFLIVSEPSLLGRRKPHRERPQPDQGLASAYAERCTWLVEESIRLNPQEFADLPGLTIGAEGWELIHDWMDDNEPLLADGARFGSSVMRGIAGKSDMQVMKIAAILHLASDERASMTIGHRHVEQAISIVSNLVETSYRTLVEREVIGRSAEFVAIESMRDLQAGKWKTERQIIQSRSRVEPFRSIDSASKSDAIRQALASMHEAGLVQMMIDGGQIKYRLPA